MTDERAFLDSPHAENPLDDSGNLRKIRPAATARLGHIQAALQLDANK